MLHGILRWISLSVLVMFGSTAIVSSAPVALCPLQTVDQFLAWKIVRCWYRQRTGEYLVYAQAYNADGSYACGRSYTYVGEPHDSKDLNSLRWVFDLNGNNYLDCLEQDPPPFTNDGSCTLPPRTPRVPIDE